MPAASCLPRTSNFSVSLWMPPSHTGSRPARAVRHIKRALEASVTVEEIFEVLKLCVSQGVQACNLGVPIVKEELACGSGQRKA